ncbi:hypothetical protein [Roseateles sp.]|uniref:hypothetical protein n=1 Tax=Roseateles sp. TaxID=1971397 RepID=UPI002F402E71
MKPILDTLRTAFSRSAEAEPPKAGQDLLTRLDEKTRSFDRDQTVFGRGRDALAVDLDGLMDTGGKAGGGRVLNATQVSRSASLMAAPQQRSDACDFIEACVNHQITHVIDLTEDNAVSGRLAMRMRAWGEELGGSQKSVHFRPAELSVGVRGMADTATNQQVQLDLKQSGVVRSRQLSWTRMACEDGKPIDPRLMLAVCVQIRGRERMVPTGPQDAKVAFMDGNGGDTAAAFSAANAMFRLNDRAPLSASDIDAEVVRTCATLRSLRSTDLFSKRPDIMDGLRQFAQLMIDERTATGERFDQVASLPEQTRQRQVCFGGKLQVTKFEADEKIEGAEVKQKDKGVDFDENRPQLLSLKARERLERGAVPPGRPTGFQQTETTQQRQRAMGVAFREEGEDTA